MFVSIHSAPGSYAVSSRPDILWPLGTYCPYFLNFLLNDLFRLKAPSTGRSASIAAFTASANGFLSGLYREVTCPNCPCLAVRPTCNSHWQAFTCIVSGKVPLCIRTNDSCALFGSIRYDTSGAHVDGGCGALALQLGACLHIGGLNNQACCGIFCYSHISKQQRFV